MVGALALNIKNEEACRLARELSQMTGESMTTAITEALRERIERKRPRKRASAERIMELGRQIAAHLDIEEGEDPFAFLYDENGMPK